MLGEVVVFRLGVVLQLYVFLLFGLFQHCQRLVNLIFTVCIAQVETLLEQIIEVELVLNL